MPGMPNRVKRNKPHPKIHETIQGTIGNTNLVQLSKLFPGDVETICKYEGSNPTGAIKARTGNYFIESGLRDGTLSPNSIVLVDSSGNQATGTGQAGLNHGIKVIAVIDPKICPWKKEMLQNLGVEIEEVTESDEHGSYLEARKRFVAELAKRHPEIRVFDQYRDPKNWQAHYFGTGSEIIRDLDGAPLNYLFCGVGTGGTIFGLSLRLREVYPNLKVIAVDEEGSCLFGGTPGERQIVGIGSSQRNPQIVAQFERECPNREVIRVTADEAFQGCRDLYRTQGICAGGSSGAVVAALRKRLASIQPHSRVLAIFPDTGDHYPNIFAEGCLGCEPTP
jgi:cysteine synthase A